MTNLPTLPRAIALFLGIVVFMAIISPSVASAQTPCNCPVVYFKVDPTITCKVNLCVRDFSGINCNFYAPGGLYPVPCNNVFAFYILDCYGNYIQVTQATPASCVCAAPGCCIDAFVVQDINGCWVLKVQPSACLVC